MAKPQSQGCNSSSGRSAPHLDSARWHELIDSVDVPGILVVIWHWMGRRLLRHATPEDVWQDTCWMAWRDREQHEWRGLRQYRAWLLGIARHRIHRLAETVATAKRGGQQRLDLFSDLSESGSRPSRLLPVATTTPSRIAWHSERAEMIMQALEELPEKLEPVVRLRLLEELPMREVAERLGIGLSTAKERFAAGARLYRNGLQRLMSR